MSDEFVRWEGKWGDDHERAYQLGYKAAEKVMSAIKDAALREENQSLLDCLNGSSKAVYTAEMYDVLRTRVEELERDRLALSDENARLNEALGEAEAKVEKVRKTINDPMVCEYQQMRNRLIENLK